MRFYPGHDGQEREKYVDGDVAYARDAGFDSQDVDALALRRGGPVWGGREIGFVCRSPALCPKRSEPHP